MNYHMGVVPPGSMSAVPTSLTDEDQVIAISTNSTDVQFATKEINQVQTILVTNTGKLPAAYVLFVAPKDLSQLVPKFLQPVLQRLRSLLQ